MLLQHEYFKLPIMYIIIITLTNNEAKKSCRPQWIPKNTKQSPETHFMHAAAQINALLYAECIKYEERLCDTAELAAASSAEKLLRFSQKEK